MKTEVTIEKKKFNVTVTHCISKTFEVEAEDEYEALEIAQTASEESDLNQWDIGDTDSCIEK